jgi:chorismate mutase
MMESSYKNGFSSKTTDKSQNDKDYNPNKTERKVCRKRTHENKNRNVVPNEINQIISFIQKKNKSGHLVSKLFEKFPP